MANTKKNIKQMIAFDTNPPIEEQAFLNDIRLTSTIHRGHSAEIFYATSPSHRSIIVKRLLARHQTPENVANLRNDFEFLVLLNGVASPKALGFVEIDGYSSILFEDTNSACLTDYSLNNIGLLDRLKIAKLWALALCELHTQGVIHRQITPSHLLVQANFEKVYIIDFSSARKMTRTQTSLPRENLIHADLYYIAPEQTGRTQNFYDERSDLYSFGISLYQLFTGRLPFEESDPLELVHAHLARTAIPPHLINDQLPIDLSHIILSLIEKSPENRYRGAIGVFHDLDLVTQKVERLGQVNNHLSLKQKDIPLRLVIPNKAYGRDWQIDNLKKQWHDVYSGKSRFILIKGASGSGKTSLIQNTGIKLWQNHAFFGTGKFEILSRDVPYEAFVQCIRRIISRIQTEPEHIYTKWQLCLRDYLGKNIHIIKEHIPELAEFISDNEQPIDLPPQEAKERLLHSFKSLFKTFTDLDHAIVIFIDDLQWADSESLELLDNLANDKIDRMLIIGTCREENFAYSQTLLSYVQSWQNKSNIFSEISIGPIDQDGILEWCCDTLNWTREQSQSIATILTQRSLGSPFYIRQIFESLYRDKFINFSIPTSSWVVNFSGIYALPVGDHLLSILQSRLREKSVVTQNIIASASFFGSHFTAEDLANITNFSLEKITLSLNDLESENLIHSIEETRNQRKTYQFLHDKIIEVCQDIFDKKQQKKIRFAIAKYIIDDKDDFSNISSHEWTKLIQATQHYAASHNLIHDKRDRTRVALLACQAADKLQSLAAWEMSSDLYRNGLDILGPIQTPEDRKISRRLQAGLGSCHIMSNKTSVAKSLFEALLSTASSDIEKAEVYSLLGSLYEAIGDHESAVRACLDGLRSLKSWHGSQNIGPLRGAWSAYRSQKKIIAVGREKILQLNSVSDEKYLIIMRLIAQAAHPAFLVNPYLGIFLTCRQINFLLSHGHSKYSTLSFLSLAMSLNGAFAVSSLRIWTKRSPEMLLDLYRSLEDSNRMDRNRLERELTYHGFASHWSDDIRQSHLDLMRLAAEFIEVRNKTYAAVSMLFCLDQGITMGFNIVNLRSTTTLWSHYIENHVEHRDKSIIKELYEIIDQIIAGETDSVLTAVERHGSELSDDPSQAARALGCQVRQGVLFGVFRRYREAYKICMECWLNGLPKRQAGNYKMPVLLFFLCLSIAETYNVTSLFKRPWRLLVMRMSRRILKIYSEIQSNFSLHKSLFSDALWHIMRGKKISESLSLIETAIEIARKGQFSLDHAVMSEYLALYLIREDKPRMALGPLISAKEAYERCGFIAKTRAIELEIAKINPLRSMPSGLKSNFSKKSQGKVSDNATLIDLPTMTRAAYTLSREIRPDQLKLKLLTILVENAGARYAALLWRNQAPDNKREALRIIAYRNTNGTFLNGEIDPSDQFVSIRAIDFVTRSKSPLIVDSVANDPMWRIDASLQKRCAKSLLCIPIIVAGEQNGAIYLENDLLEFAFSPDRLSIIGILAGQIAISLDNASLYEQLNNSLDAEKSAREEERKAHEAYVIADTARSKLIAGLEAAEIVQKSLINVRKHDLSYEIAHLFKPAENTGGDWLTTIFDQNHRWLYLCLGDVTGHGVPAALVTAAVAGAATSTVARSMRVTTELQVSVTEMMRAMNAAVAATRGEHLQLMTMVVIGIDLETGLTHYCNAGHHPILWVSSETKVILESADPLGYSDTPLFGSRTFQLQAGDRLLLYSDGLIENLDVNGKKIRLSKLKTLASNHIEPQDLITNLLSYFDVSNNDTSRDDTACMVFRWTPMNVSLIAG